MYFRKYRLRKSWLDQCLKSRVSEDPSIDNMGNWSKHCCNLNGNTCTIFMNHCEGNCIGIHHKISFSDIQNPKTVLLTH